MTRLHHHVARSADRAPLWTTWADGVALFRRVVRAAPGLAALVVMPDHLHLLHPDDVHVALARALSGHTRARRARHPRAAGFAPMPSVEAITDSDKARRSVRYVHLNPCRARLCADPLAWPLSTHRDRTGLAWPAVVRARAEPDLFHRYVSADPTVDVRGTELPARQVGSLSAADVLDAVSALTRTPLSALRERGPARTLYLAAARELTGARTAEIAALVEVDPTRVGRSRAPAEAVRLVGRVATDRRFAPLLDEELRLRR